jgi:acetyl esterase/lipase
VFAGGTGRFPPPLSKGAHGGNARFPHGTEPQARDAHGLNESIASIQRNLHRYGDDRSQLGELFLPACADGAPVAVVIHGGFWRDAYDRSLMDDLCEDLASAGWAAWNLEYRRLGGGGGWPETFEDVEAGIDCLSGFSELELRLVATIGHSAGGHLALWAAARDEPGVRVTHAVAQAGVVDLVEAARLGLSRGVAEELLGGSPSQVPDRYELACPVARVPLGVPQLLVHGGRDDIVPARMSRDYARVAEAAGDAVELVVHEQLGHFEHLDPGSAAWESVRSWLSEVVS